MTEPFTFNERLLLFLTIEGSCLSIAAVGSILFFVIYKFLRRTVLTWGKSVHHNMDATDSSLFLNLMFADLLQAIVHHGGYAVYCTGCCKASRYCGGGYDVIGVHTFSILVLRWRSPKHTSKFMVIFIWVFAALVIGIPNIVHLNHRYYGKSGYWCWIVLDEDFTTEQIVTEYLWVWVAGFTMMILYGIMFVVMRGWIVLDGGIHWYKNYNPKHPSLAVLETEEERASKEIANLMLFYPAVYIICVFPNNLSRWLTFSHQKEPYQFKLLASALYALSGLFNVLLFFSTRPELVKGPNVIIESDDGDLPLHDRNEASPLTPIPNSRLGHLPERSYNRVDDRSPTTDTWPAHGRGDSGSFDPRASALLDHGGHGAVPVYSSSPTAFNGSLALPTHTRNDSYRSNEFAKKSRESASLMEEEEDYGRLPGA